MEIGHDKIFAFKHNHLFNSLDNEVLMQILRSCTNKNSVKLQMNNKECVEVLPVKIIHDSTYGRQYLYCYDIDRKHQRVIRIDRVISADCKKRFGKNDKELVQGMMSFLDECWCTSGVNENLKEIVIEFRFDEVTEAYILRRITNEGHGGEVKKIQEGVYEYRAMLRDPNEMIPWIRSVSLDGNTVFDLATF